ncbi:MAG: hypothetical protein JOY59_00740 [Candidatus Eremiobacteraeota bacterium]|nr:hypothetical protein [Candidatus Eremiobacteraeota bacterium]
MLYPHLDADVGFSQLKVYVHRVRRKLGYAQAILFEAEAYRLAPDVLVDLVDAEAAVADAVPTRGALAPASRARLNEIRRRLLARRIIWTDDREWCNALERRLESLLSDVTWRLGEAALADGDFAAATRLAAEVCMLDPSDERAAELAIRAHLRAGDDLGARTRFRRYERVLKKEFDMSPSAELAALVTQTARATA